MRPLPRTRPPCAHQELDKLKRGKREHQEERAALLRRLEEDKKERAEKFASHQAVAQQASAAGVLRRSPLACSKPRTATPHPPRISRDLSRSSRPTPPPSRAVQAQAPSSSSGTTSTLSLRTEDGALRHTFSADATLLEVRAWLHEEQKRRKEEQNWARF